jgi:hypothetical protein
MLAVNAKQAFIAGEYFVIGGNYPSGANCIC